MPTMIITTLRSSLRCMDESDECYVSLGKDVFKARAVRRMPEFLRRGESELLSLRGVLWQPIVCDDSVEVTYNEVQ